MADNDAKLPIRGLAVDLTTEVANVAGTTINPAEDYPQGSLTTGQNGVLEQGAVTTAAPSYTSGQTSPLSLTTTGNLRVDGSSTTQPVSGTVTVTQATGTNLHTVVDNFPADSDALAQGSTTSGQLGELIMGAVTTAAPSYTTAQTSPLSLDTSGNLRVVSSSNNIQELINYNTVAAVAAAATSTHSFTPGSTVSLDGIDVAASGQAKWELQWGMTGSETSKMVIFTSKSEQTQHFKLANPVQITSAMTIKIIRTNSEPALAQDLYSTIQYH